MSAMSRSLTKPTDIATCAVRIDNDRKLFWTNPQVTAAGDWRHSRAQTADATFPLPSTERLLEVSCRRSLGCGSGKGFACICISWQY